MLELGKTCVVVHPEISCCTHGALANAHVNVLYSRHTLPLTTGGHLLLHLSSFFTVHWPHPLLRPEKGRVRGAGRPISTSRDDSSTDAQLVGACAEKEVVTL